MKDIVDANITANITYTDWDGTVFLLTQQELDWFRGLVEHANAVTGNTVPIIPYNHDFYRGKSKNALGCCISSDRDNPLSPDAETIITIDTWYIHEKYQESIGEMPCIEPAPILETIAHELAHLSIWRHGKRHTALTAKIYQHLKGEQDEILQC